MPREHIPTATNTDIEIAWGRDHGSVQVATTITDGPARIQAILAENGLKLANATTGTDPGTAQLEAAMGLLGGWHGHIEDRAGVNRLIRVLKAARDQAFGKDE